ncbi:hypothetical protein ES703_47187 [subsurface metagenome]
MSNDVEPEKMKQELTDQLVALGIKEEDARKQASEQIDSMGVIKISTGKCPLGAVSPMACMVCCFGHMTDCHYPLTCQEANCSHYRAEMVAEFE